MFQFGNRINYALQNVNAVLHLRSNHLKFRKIVRLFSPSTRQFIYTHTLTYNTYMLINK